MGAEALSKVARRDLRRAFAPEASAEIIRFVEHCEAEFDKKLEGVERAWTQGLSEVDAHAKGRLELIEKAFDAWTSQLTFRQRMRWLIRGTWQ